MATGRDRRDQRIEGLHIGRVTRRDDPDGLGRVRVEIPGLLEPESDWAWPLGSPGGGTAQRGSFRPPAVDSTVGVLFNQGEIDEPYYLTGPWGSPDGESDIPTGAAVGTGGDLRDRQVAVEEDGEWRLTVDSTTVPGGKRWLLEHISTGLSILLDGDADEIHLVSPASDQALVRGTDYRQEESSLLMTVRTNLNSAGVFLQTAGSDITLSTLAPTAAAAIKSAGGQLIAAALSIGASPIATATAYLSTKAFTE